MMCRQICAEALPMFYAENTFALDILTGVTLDAGSAVGRLHAKQSGIARMAKWMKVKC